LQKKWRKSPPGQKKSKEETSDRLRDGQKEGVRSEGRIQGRKRKEELQGNIRRDFSKSGEGEDKDKSLCGNDKETHIVKNIASATEKRQEKKKERMTLRGGGVEREGVLGKRGSEGKRTLNNYPRKNIYVC